MCLFQYMRQGILKQTQVKKTYTKLIQNRTTISENEVKWLPMSKYFLNGYIAGKHKRYVHSFERQLDRCNKNGVVRCSLNNHMIAGYMNGEPFHSLTFSPTHLTNVCN